jgi:peroxiredoxin
MAPARWSFAAGCAVGALLAVFAPLALLLGTALLFPNQMRELGAEWRSQRLKAPPLGLGSTADYGLRLRDGAGAETTLEQFRGKAVLLHFWAPDCTQCMAEWPAIRALHAQLDPARAEIVAVALAPPAPEAPPPPFAQYTLVGERPGIYASNAVPATFILSPAGEIVLRHIGSARWDAPEIAALLHALHALKSETQQQGNDHAQPD